ncbi:MAG: 1,2-phenylacetyl-CoA epoxidase subunit PaaD [Ferruginibacter sp.]|nr:phenylacetate-CoA oxygenase subunit PaaJ [Ferruginibacter sp.]
MVTLNNTLTVEDVWGLLNQIIDPDIPVINIVELGLVRNVKIGTNNCIVVTLTPSYSGCPAMHVFKEEITTLLKENGANAVEIVTTLLPAWSTDWLSAETKAKLKHYGIAPPQGLASDNKFLFSTKKIICPRCESNNTKLISQFGSTACKALYKCDACEETFDYFKCH